MDAYRSSMIRIYEVAIKHAVYKGYILTCETASSLRYFVEEMLQRRRMKQHRKLPVAVRG